MCQGSSRFVVILATCSILNLYHFKPPSGLNLSSNVFKIKISFFQHANSVRRKHSQIMEQIAVGEYKRRAPSFQVPEADLPIRENVTPGTWFV